MTRGQASYDVHPGVEWTQKWMAGLKEKTGRTESEWRALVKKAGPKDPAKCRAWLSKEHGLGSRNAWYFSMAEDEMSWGADEKGNETREKPKDAVKTPADLAAMLKAAPKAKTTFDALTPRMKNEWIHWIEDAKQVDTRARRIDRARERLGKGLKGIY